MIGQTLSHYRVTAALGAGGMGEVYRATDANLARDVAIKVLPPEVAQDPERLGRFKREAHLLAALNHPNIAAIHGLEEADGKPFLVLELVEGQDLRERLEKGPVPVDEALEIAEQVAEALEEAHDKGIVHRDLKPANVKLTPDGKVKVLDFGLAKAWAGEPGERSGSSASMSQSPTLAHSGTVAGVILGTAAYMSPEQARGKPVDKRADVWSFGVLLWEMLTGRPLFTGDTVTDVIAAVVTREPDLEALPAETPPAVRRLVGRCLRRDPRKRLPDIGAARLDLQEAGTESASRTDDAAADATAERGGRRRRIRERWIWGVVGLAAGSLGALIASRASETTAGPAGTAHFAIEMENGWQLAAAIPALSPDGRHVAFCGSFHDGQVQVWLRPIDSLTARSFEETAAAGLYGPFWSPDGKSIGFFSWNERELRRLDLTTGGSRTLCTLPTGFTLGATWSRDGIVLFSDDGRLYTVPAEGGEPEPLGPDEEEAPRFWPQFLPDQRHYLYVAGGSDEHGGLRVASLDTPGRSRLVRPGPARTLYVPSGHLLYTQERTLLAQRFDSTHTEVVDEPIPVAEGLTVFPQNPSLDWGYFSASASGVLVYTEGEANQRRELVWLDRKGERIGTVGKAADYGQIALSPDESRLAVELASDIWTMDLARGVPTRLTSEPGDHIDPVWSPDGRELAFTVYREGQYHLHRKSLAGSEPERPLLELPQSAFPEDWTGGGATLLYITLPPEAGVIWAATPGAEVEPEPLVETPAWIDEPHLSPDGRWLAYTSVDSGQSEVYVGPFRRPGETVRVSPEGGGQPRWRGDGRELFYVTSDGRLMAVTVRAGKERLEFDLPEALFGGVIAAPNRDHYAVTADGQRFLVTVPVDQGEGQHLHVVVNWPSLLESR